MKLQLLSSTMLEQHCLVFVTHLDPFFLPKKRPPTQYRLPQHPPPPPPGGECRLISRARWSSHIFIAKRSYRDDSIPIPLLLLTAAPALRLWLALIPLFLSLCALCFASPALTPLPRPLDPPFWPPWSASSFPLSFLGPRCLRFIRALSTSWGSSDFVLPSSVVELSSLSSSSSSEGTGDPPKTRGIVKGLQKQQRIFLTSGVSNALRKMTTYWVDHFSKWDCTGSRLNLRLTRYKCTRRRNEWPTNLRSLNTTKFQDYKTIFWYYLLLNT